MSVTIAQFADHINRDVTDPKVSDMLDLAEDLVQDYMSEGWAPESVMDYAVKTVGDAINDRYNSVNGAITFGVDDAPVLVAKDLLSRAKPQLDRYKDIGGIA